MPDFALDAFEPQAEAFSRARAWREWQYQSGQRPGRSLVTLYDEDFPDFTSKDLFNDLLGTNSEEPTRTRALSGLLAAASLEGRTRELASKAGSAAARTTVRFEEEDIVWREAPARWPLIGDVPRRHELAESWRAALATELNPVLGNWLETLRSELQQVVGQEWLPFWSEQRGISLEDMARLATTVLQTGDEVYGHALGVYLSQVGLPIDDAWVADADWAFRAARFDVVFPERERMPVLIRTFAGLGIDLESQSELHFEAGPQPGVRYCPVEMPGQVHVLLRLTGGYRDYLRSLRGLGIAQHALHTDPRLPFWQRWLGDDTPTLGYGLLLEGLVRDRAWLLAHVEYENSSDFRVIAHLAWLYRVRRLAASALYEQLVWHSEPGGSLAADFEVRMSEALRLRCFPDEYLRLLQNAPWSTLESAIGLRAEVFAAQLREYLAREFDEEWWRFSRAAKFLRDELWRPGRRHSAQELLGFMGFEGFDPGVLWGQIAEVLAPL
ncbi:MAG TPA: hypothetical protein VFG86_19465 [Chloroflexota bacterium]|jgi:hypothetical protein|nr:hypothetical protein [Chloroflexota bacterium]